MKILIAALIFSQTVLAAEFDKKVTVSGQCTLETTPDRGSVTFVSSHLEPLAKTAIFKSTELYEKLRTELKKSSVKNLELASTEYSVQERKEWENNKSVSKGFEARLGLKAITTDIAALGDLMAIAAKVGVKETHSLQIFLSESKALEEKKKCLDIAAKNAKEKAETLVKSLGAKLGRVLLIVEGGTSPQTMPGPVFEKAMLRSSSGGDAPIVEAQKQIISLNVDVTFEIE